LVAFRNSLAGKLSSTSINRYISVLRMLFKTAKRDGYVLENPVEFVELVKNDLPGPGYRWQHDHSG
jgi:site-specific recombinase XerD